MKVFIDADGCPVTDIAVGLADSHGICCMIVCDTAHQIQRDGAQTITVDKGADSADFLIAGLVGPCDIVITQDYGLAAMCLTRGARVLHQDGYEYTSQNIDGLLYFRAEAKRARRGGARMKGPKKRAKAQDDAFYAALQRLLQEART
ncbi:MAG: DUF188 domain-containing protein [Oscillospiraceae bacterium]|nr:DUF188 domain-containing protein [Oscillospiraceae bacterium]